MINLYDSGFAMDDEAEDEKALSEGHFSQGANLSPRVQKVYIDFPCF
jgi:hypothetical protein